MIKLVFAKGGLLVLLILTVKLTLSLILMLLLLLLILLLRMILLLVTLIMGIYLWQRTGCMTFSTNLRRRRRTGSRDPRRITRRSLDYFLRHRFRFSWGKPCGIIEVAGRWTEMFPIRWSSWS